VECAYERNIRVDGFTWVVEWWNENGGARPPTPQRAKPRSILANEPVLRHLIAAGFEKPDGNNK